MKDSAGSVRTRAMLASWFFCLAVTMFLSALVVLAIERCSFESALQERYLLGMLAVFLGCCAWWARFGWFRVAEGKVRFIEYGGTGNLLQRIRFDDGRVWQLIEPLNVRLDVDPGRKVVVEENFFDRNRIGVLVVYDPWRDDDDGRYDDL